jgi:hypothetical protein
METGEQEDEAVGHIVEVDLIIIFLTIGRGLELLQRGEGGCGVWELGHRRRGREEEKGPRIGHDQDLC